MGRKVLTEEGEGKVTGAISQFHISKFIQRWLVGPNLRDIML